MNCRVPTTCLWAVLVFAALLAGCSGDIPEKPKPINTTQPSVRSTPQDVLKYLANVYSIRDSVAIKSIYDSTYTGVSTDLLQPLGSQHLNFTYADEVEHVAALARTHTITSVKLSFGSMVRLQSDDITHPEWAHIEMSSLTDMTLDIEDGPNSVTVGPAASAAESFSLKPTTPDSTSPTDTTWKIVRWYELSPVAP